MESLIFLISVYFYACNQNFILGYQMFGELNQ